MHVLALCRDAPLGGRTLGGTESPTAGPFSVRGRDGISFLCRPGAVSFADGVHVAERSIIAAVTTLVALCVGTYLAFTIPLNHDAAWLLYLSQQVLGGARLYVDLVEVNPPLIIWLGIPVILAERSTGISYVTLFPAVIAGIGIVSVALCNCLSGHLETAQRSAFTSAVAVALFVAPVGIWGQREHILVLLTLPYIVASAARGRGVDPRMPRLLGIAAGLGFALKPHFLLVFAVFEGWLFLTQRRLWKGALYAAGVIVAYGLVVVTMTDYVPQIWALRAVYGSFAPGPRLLLVSAYGALLALSIAAMLVRGDGQHLRTTFAVATAAWGTVAVIQGKGWGYHFFPAIVAAVCLVALALIGLNSRRVYNVPAALLPAMLALAAAMMAPLARSYFDNPEIAEATAAIRGRPALILSPYIEDVWPHVSYARAQWRAPSASLWPALTGERGAELAAQWATDAIAEPAVAVTVLVPVREHRSALPLLMQDNAFRAAWADYDEVARGLHYAVFTSRHQGSRPQ
jgi:hypothetical protein